MEGRDFKAEIDAAQNDPVQLRKIASDIQACCGSRILMIRALHLAQSSDGEPHPLGRVSEDLGLPRPIDVPLYRYKLEPGLFKRVEEHLSASLSSSFLRLTLAPAFVLWAADWFRRSYQGGMRRWSDIEDALGVRRSQSDWRKLADDGFRAWGVDALVTAHGNQRLSNLARQGGFPAAAIMSGASWPSRFLERTVGELLGSDVQDIGAAINACERNEYLLPEIWRSQEMHAICGELTLKIVELRNFADNHVPDDGRPYSVRLEEVYPEWREELPMTLDGAAAGLVDTLLEVKLLNGRGSVRVGRSMRLHGEVWRETLDFHLDGLWDDRSGLFQTGEYVRIFLQPVDALADYISGRLAFLEYKENSHWVARAMRSERGISFPFCQSVMAAFHTRGKQVGQNIVLPGGKPVRDGMRVFEKCRGGSGFDTFSLIGQGSGGYRSDPVFIDLPRDWSIRSKDSNGEILLEDTHFANNRRLYRCSGQIIVRATNDDLFLVRSGQNADRKDRLSIWADSASGVHAPEAGRLFKHPLHVQVEDGLSRRTATHGEVCWRHVGEKDWRKDLNKAGPGRCEFAWLDAETGHVRDRMDALIFPKEFKLSQHIAGSYSNIQLDGWQGSVSLEGNLPDLGGSWKVRIDPPNRAHAILLLAPDQGPAFELNIPLRSREWLTTWEGELLKRDSKLSLADLRDTVARVPSIAVLMGEVIHHSGTSLDASWKINGELGLSALRTDIAALMRPLGIDAQVKLGFHNGRNDFWYVTEFGNSLEWATSGGLNPKVAVIGDDVRVCGRFLGAPDKEIDFGLYVGPQGGHGCEQIQLPRLKGAWLIYLREGARVLTRPKFVPGDLIQEVPQHKLGRAMIQPLEFARESLQALAKEIEVDPTSSEADKTIQTVMNLVLSLNGLPPQTFEVFCILDNAGALAPLMLYRCEEQHLSTIIELFDGLCSSWVLLPHSVWRAAFQAQGKFLVARLDDPQWAIANISARENEIVARAPQLAPLICRDFSPLTWGEVRSHFTEHTSEGLSADAGALNPFRPDFKDLLPEENFAEDLMRVFDAPFVAALASLGRITLDSEQILTVKDAERHHPSYFGKALGFALSEYKNGQI